jgi:hypothetical protein
MRWCAGSSKAPASAPGCISANSWRARGESRRWLRTRLRAKPFNSCSILGDAPGAQSADVAIQPLIDPLRCEQSRRAGRQRGQSRQSVAAEWQRRVSAEAQRLIRANKLSN